MSHSKPILNSIIPPTTTIPGIATPAIASPPSTRDVVPAAKPYAPKPIAVSIAVSNSIAAVYLPIIFIEIKPKVYETCQCCGFTKRFCHKIHGFYNKYCGKNAN